MPSINSGSEDPHDHSLRISDVREACMAGSWRRLPPRTYVELVTSLLSPIGRVLIAFELALGGLLAGLAAFRTGDVILAGITALTSVLLLSLLFIQPPFESSATSPDEARHIEHKLELRTWLAGLGVGAMGARVLLASNDPLAQSLIGIAALASLAIALRLHPRPHIFIGKAVAILVPISIAALFLENGYYAVAAVAGWIIAAIFFGLCLDLHSTAQRMITSVHDKELLANALKNTIEEVQHREGQRQEIERALQRVQADLIHVSRINAMGTIASTLAHEINQPLTAVSNYLRGSVRLLDRDSSPHLALVKDGLKSAEEATDRVADIVRRIRALVFRGEVETKPHDLENIITKAIQLGLASTDEAELAYSVEIEPRAHWVHVDSVQIQQVLTNLVRNASQAMADSPRREIQIKAEAISGSQVQLSVSDSGPGISAAMQDTLFTSFQTDKPEGMGIGLSVSRTIIEAHGGQIWTESSPGGGATFLMTLPRWKMVTPEPDGSPA
jgi:signal transduction histidine kinase